MTSNAVEGAGWVPALNFPARLALVRNRMGWNAKEAALACGLPAQSWRNWENGSRPHDYLGVCQLISERTGASLEWLLGLAEPRGTEIPGTTRRYDDDMPTALEQLLLPARAA